MDCYKSKSDDAKLNIVTIYSKRFFSSQEFIKNKILSKDYTSQHTIYLLEEIT